MDKKALKEFFTRRSTIWTLSLCMTGIIVLGGIAAVDGSRRSEEQQVETEAGELAFLEDEDPEDINDTLASALNEESEGVDLAEASGTAVQEGEEGLEEMNGSVDSVSGEDGGASDGAEEESAEAASSSVISEQALLNEGISFTEEEALMWPSAGTILIDYSMDGSVYFPTLNQYKYNPALIIGSEVGNQVLAAARGMVESIYVDDETGTTLVMNIGNGYKLTYGQLKELVVEEGDIVEEGAVLGYVSEPTKYYSKEGGNLYFQMTQNDASVDPVLYLE